MARGGREPMDEPTRRAWSKPELIVLVRGKPEEAVLNACKAYGQDAADAYAYDRCQKNSEVGCVNCAAKIGT